MSPSSQIRERELRGQTEEGTTEEENTKILIIDCCLRMTGDDARDVWLGMRGHGSGNRTTAEAMKQALWKL